MPDFYDYFKQFQISKEEQDELFQKYKKDSCLQSKEKLVLSFIPLALKICEKIYSKNDAVYMSELLNESYLAIHEAVERYNPSRSALSTFVYRMVRWRLNAYISEQYCIVKYPSSVRKKMKALKISLNYISLDELDYNINKRKNGKGEDYE